MAKSGKTTKSRNRKSNNHGAAFVVGSLLGGLVGAVAALWSTPQSGAELRAKLSAAVPTGSDSPTMNFSTVPASAPAPSEQPPVSRTEDPGDLPETGIGHAATTEELTRPPDTTPTTTTTA